MERRKFQSTLGSLVEEGDLASQLLNEILARQSLFSAPVDTPPNILSRVDSQFIVFVFEIGGLRIDDRAKKREYISDSLLYQLSRDTVAPRVEEPLRRNNTDSISVAFQVSDSFNADDTRLIWSGEQTEVVWPIGELINKKESSRLANSPKFTVENVTIPNTTSSDRATVEITVRNDGYLPGKFKSIVRSDDETYIDTKVQPEETVTIPTEIHVSDTSQSVVVSWGTDERSAVINKT